MTNTPSPFAVARVPSGGPRRSAVGFLMLLGLVAWPQAAQAQLDPLLLLKRSLPSITTPQYRANVLVAVDVAPHSLLFPRAAVVVQQCGIGTMAQSLRSGRPMLAVPFAHDQPDNAWRAARLGMARTIHPGRYRSARIAAGLRRLVDDPSYTTAAAAVAAQVSAEGGAQSACDALERTFRL